MVKGEVTLDEKPIQGVHIRFVPKDENACETAGGFTRHDGSFKLSSLNGDPETGAMFGDYAVTFSKLERPPNAKPGSNPVETLPLIYADPETTPFSASVQKGRNKNKFEFALKSDAPPHPSQKKGGRR